MARTHPAAGAGAPPPPTAAASHPAAGIGGAPPTAAASPAPVPAPAAPPAPAREADVLAPLYPQPRLMLARGQGTWAWDDAGRRYLDFTAGLGVLALGHGRRDLAAVAARQLATLSHCSNLFGNQPALRLATQLQQASGAARVAFANSGAEANEAAFKFARLVGRARGGAAKHVVLALEGGFHGRTLGALSLTHRPSYREPFTPLVPGVRFAPFNDLAAAAAQMDGAVCAVFVEPVQGEGGVHVASDAYLHGLRALCDAHGALLVCDEIQCGMGRTGTLFAHAPSGVRPDMVTLAKPLAGGLPIGAVLMADAVAAAIVPGLHGSTFAGNPVACAVGEAVLEVVAAPAFLADVRARGQHLAARLQALVAAVPVLFTAARGRGLMQAVALRTEGPDAMAVLRAARAAGLLLTRAGPRTVRLLPPLTVNNGEIDRAITLLARAAATVLAPKS